jgi:hypothetical protein
VGHGVSEREESRFLNLGNHAAVDALGVLADSGSKAVEMRSAERHGER